jgi:hypothetical protein
MMKADTACREPVRGLQTGFSNTVFKAIGDGQKNKKIFPVNE